LRIPSLRISKGLGVAYSLGEASGDESLSTYE
jgi:hypothetical protein